MLRDARVFRRSDNRHLVQERTMLSVSHSRFEIAQKQAENRRRRRRRSQLQPARLAILRDNLWFARGGPAQSLDFERGPCVCLPPRCEKHPKSLTSQSYLDRQ